MLRNTENSWGTVAKAFHCLRSTLIIGQLKEWWSGPEWIAGFANSHFMRLSALCASVEPRSVEL